MSYESDIMKPNKFLQDRSSATIYDRFTSPWRMSGFSRQIAEITNERQNTKQGLQDFSE